MNPIFQFPIGFSHGQWRDCLNARICYFQFPIGFSQQVKQVQQVLDEINFQFPIGFSQRHEENRLVTLVELSIPYRILTASSVIGLKEIRYNIFQFPIGFSHGKAIKASISSKGSFNSLSDSHQIVAGTYDPFNTNFQFPIGFSHQLLQLSQDANINFQFPIGFSQLFCYP